MRILQSEPDSLVTCDQCQEYVQAVIVLPGFDDVTERVHIVNACLGCILKGTAMLREVVPYRESLDADVTSRVPIKE